MSEEENESVEAVASGAAPTSESEVSQDDRQQQESERRQRNDAEYNWAEMRRKMQEKDREIQELRDQFSQINRKSAAPEEDELSKLAEDDILTVAQAKKLATKMARSVAEEVISKREASTVDERIQVKFPDYRDVVTKESIELLKQTEPELAMSLYHIPDPYNQAIAAYKLLKKTADKTEARVPLEKKKAIENSQKPVSVQSVAKNSAIGNAHMFENGLTPELKKQLYAEMRAAAKAG